MNFDGTYPEKEEEKLLRAKNDRQHPPVRVIVSYPQTEEWDGKNTKCYTGFKWFLIVGLLALVAAAGVIFYFFVLRNGDADGNKHRPGTFENNYLNDGDLKKYIMQQVTMHYENVRREMSHAEQLQFFMNEIKTLQEQNLTHFVRELNIAIPLALPQNNDIQNEIIDDLYNYAMRVRSWLIYMNKLEYEMTSYEFQISDKINLENNFGSTHNWSKLEIEEIERIKKKFTKPLEVIIKENQLEIYGNVVVFSEAISRIPNHINLEQVMIVASILHMDRNFTRNIDLLLFASDWRFQSPISLDLSGPDAPKPNNSIQNGGNGESGKDGGFFIAGGNLNLTLLNVTSNGGSAARGYNGKNGRNGIPNLMPLPEATSYHCVVPNDNPFENSAHETIQQYRVYHDLSCGELGQPGGPPGEPGQGGRIMFFLPNQVIEKVGVNGKKAAKGFDGINGASARSSCYYSAYKVIPLWRDPNHITEEHWTPITTTLCQDAQVLPLIKNFTREPVKFDDNTRNLTKVVSAISKFSKAARDELEFERNEQLFAILKDVESSTFISNLTSPTLLFEEFNEIEEKYSNIAIYNSFSNKVNLVLNLSLDDETKYALEYLDVAVWTKMSLIRSDIGEYYIVDIDKYLDQLLNTVKRLDIKVLKVSTFSEQLKGELKGKFEKIKTSLKPFAGVTCNSPVDEDRRILCLISTLSKILTSSVDIASQVLSNKVEKQESYEIIKKCLEKYKYNKSKYFLNMKYDVLTNSTFACAEMMIANNNCTESSRWESFSRMDRALFKAFDKLAGKDVLLEISYVVTAILREVHETRAVTPMAHYWVREFRDVAEDLSALLRSSYRVSMDRLLENKLETLGLRQVNSKHLACKVTKTKKIILESLLRDQYMRAVRAYQQWVFPFTDTIEVVGPGAKQSELINAIQAIKDARTSYSSTINDRDSQIIKAEFRISSRDPFYTWRNRDYHIVIKELLSGQVVKMRSNILDSGHVLNKQSIKFQVAELSLTGVPFSLMKEFNVEMIHSGYSNYMYNGTMFTTVGPEIVLFHSFDHNRRGGVPKKYSVAYEKIKKGELMLSPYTSWTIQLKPNPNGDFSNLQKYVNMTDVHLVGFGSYVQLTRRQMMPSINQTQAEGE